MAGYWLTALALIWIWTVAPAWSDAQDIGILQTEYRQLTALADSLHRERRIVAAEAEGLSARIDSLKEMHSEPEELHEALRTSLVLVRRIVDIDRRLEGLKAHQDSVKEHLRLAYDWEIGMLIQEISQEPDRGLLAQLMVYQEEREALGDEPVGQGWHYGEEMAISPDDGPDEIRQKMELMEDIATRLKGEARKTDEQLLRLEEERRLRNRVRVFTREISLFDEHLPEGRVLVRSGDQETLSDATPGSEEGVPGGELRDHNGLISADGPLSPSSTLMAQREQAREGQLLPMEGGGVDEVTLEIHKLKAHQQEIRQLEMVVRERAVRFRQYLHQMLEGKE